MNSKLTPLQIEILRDRLSLDDCLLEVMRDTYYEDGKAMPSDAELELAFGQVNALLVTKNLETAGNMSEHARWILEDCYDGSTWTDRADNAFQDGEISQQKLAAERRAFENLGEKLRAAGLEV